MNLDKTFCVNKTCELKEKCDRHLDHYREFLDGQRWVSMSDFENSSKDKHECYVKRIKHNG